MSAESRIGQLFAPRRMFPPGRPFRRPKWPDRLHLVLKQRVGNVTNFRRKNRPSDQLPAGKRSGETGTLSAGSPDRRDLHQPGVVRPAVVTRYALRHAPSAWRFALCPLRFAPSAFRNCGLNFPPADTSGTPKNLIPGKLGSKSSKPSKLGGPMGVNSGILHL